MAEPLRHDPNLDLLRSYFESEIKRVEALVEAEIELRRARREDDLRAQSKFEDSVSRRFNQVNEFRGALSDLGATMATQTDVKTLTERVSRSESFQAKLAGAMALVILLVPIAVAFVVRTL